jgi:hypothetical protein
LRHRKKITLIIILLVLEFVVTNNSRGAELHIEPFATLSGEYNDNYFLQKEDPIEEYILRAIFGLGVDYTSLRAELDILYAPEYRYFVNYKDYSNDDDNDEIAQFLDAKGKYILVNNLLNIEVRDVYERVSLSTTRDYTKFSLFLNQSDRNTLMLNPYFSIRLSSTLLMNVGYMYINIWYDKDEGQDSIVNNPYAEFYYDISPNMTFFMQYRYTLREYETQFSASDFEKHDVFMGGKYEYGEDSFLSLGAGYSFLDYEGGVKYRYPYWNAEISHRFYSLVTSFSTDRYLNENPTGDPQIVDKYRLTLRSLTHRIPEGPETIYTPYPLYAEKSPSVDQEKTTFNLSFYLNGLTNTTPENLDRITYRTDYDSITYGADASLHHYLSQKIIGEIKLTSEIEEDMDPYAYSILYLTGARMVYLLSPDSNLALIYAYTESYSPYIENNNYHNNRIIASISITF